VLDANTVIVADRGNNVLRKLTRVLDGTGAELRWDTSLFAGSPVASGETDGTGSAALFSFLNGLVADGTYLYVADSERIRRVTRAGAVVTTVAQKPAMVLSENDLIQPMSIALNSSGTASTAVVAQKNVAKNLL